MGLEKRGTQFRIRVQSPKVFKKPSFRTLDVGTRGGLMFVRAIPKGQSKFRTQSFRVSTKDFRREGSKLIPRTARGKRERTSLKRQAARLVKKAVNIYF